MFKILLPIIITFSSPAFAQTGRLDLMSIEQKVAAGESYHQQLSSPVEPFRIVGNVYYVGALNIASYLITTPEGHFLIDTGVSEMGQTIRDNVEKLGFKLSDIEIILSSHAHFDHIQGHAVMKRLTGALVVASDADADAFEAGKDLSPLGFEGWEPVKVDRRVHSGEPVSLGGVTLTPTVAAGHTPGCTTWSFDTEDRGETLNIAIFGCNGPNDGVQLLNNPNFPTLIEDTLAGFDSLATLNPDIYLTGHPQEPFANIINLMRVQVRPHPLLQQQPWQAHIADRRALFLERVEAEEKQ